MGRKRKPLNKGAFLQKPADEQATVKSTPKIGQGKRPCRYCRQPIEADALVCQHCARDQRPWVQRFGNTTIAVSIIISAFMLAMSYSQLKSSRQKEASAEKALQQAEEALAKAHDAVSLTEDAVKNLRKLAIQTTSATLILAEELGHTWLGGGFSQDVREKAKETLVAALANMGIGDAQQKKILDDCGWNGMVERLYLMRIMGISAPKGLSPEQTTQWKKLQWRPSQPNPDVNEIAEFCEGCGILTDDRKEWIEDYGYYREFREHRRPEVFRKAYP
jgi:hypothetical protein